MTTLHRVDRDAPEAAVLMTAADVLGEGELVAFATETVYGLGADATQPDAVAKIFASKGRPQTNPLIAHVASVEMARAWAGAWPVAAQRIAEALWPGPITLIVPRVDALAPAVSAGLDTVGLRVPAPAVARGLIEALGRPVAAPSANRSEHVSPTTAQHVLDDLRGRVHTVLDSGPTAVGIESTVVDVSGPTPRLLRRGPVSAQALEAVVGGAVVVVDAHVDGATAQSSPGQSVRHYAPDVPTVRFERGQPLGVGPADALLVVGPAVESGAAAVVMLEEPDGAARALYATLRQLEARSPDRIVIVMPPRTAAWAAVRDRLVRASVTPA